MERIICIILVFLMYLVISFGITAGIIYLVFWLLGISFSWKITLAIWLILGLIRTSFKLTISE